MIKIDKKRFIIFLTIVIVVTFGLFYFLQVSKNHFLNIDSVKTSDEEGEDKDENEEINSKSKTFSILGSIQKRKEVNDDGQYIIPVITDLDCTQKCNSRKGIEIEYKYCKEICQLDKSSDGDSSAKNNKEGIEDEEVDDIYDCDDVEDIFEEDICWKNKAIKERNKEYCDELYNADLKKICQTEVVKN
jgi:hypothetical protein